VKRDDLQRLSRIRLAEANTLLRGGHFDGAYYLAGYAVECGLKAVIARATERYAFPDRTAVNDSYTHNLDKLVKVARLQPELNVLLSVRPRFALHWAVVKDWNEESRYSRHTPTEARNLYGAIADRKDGIMRWIRQHW
jgi:HEPN domain-containing protein